MVIDNELKNVMRSHHDLEKDNTPYMKKATRVRVFLGFIVYLRTRHFIHRFVFIFFHLFVD